VSVYFVPLAKGGCRRQATGDCIVQRKHNKTLTPKAKALRKNMTPQERKLWYEFLRTYPVRFLRQKVIGRFVADFYCAKAKLVIELDGSQHYTEDVRYDEKRTKILEAYGLKVIRFYNGDVDRNFLGVCQIIDAETKGAIHCFESDI
jgi:very-short-patch-repair endonuclease